MGSPHHEGFTPFFHKNTPALPIPLAHGEIGAK
jgi:hypothetical protein